MSESASRSNGVAEPLLPHNWQELAPLVDAVLDAPPERRAAVLTELSAGDPDRRLELEHLVAECERDVPLLNRPAAERFAGLLDEATVRVPASLAERYPVTRELGRGGMAVVYLARDLKHGRDVAVKVVRPELAAALGRERFLREIAIAAQLHHPHIVPLYDSGEADGFLYYVMPYEDGPSLRARLGEEGALPVSDAMGILRDLARALAYAHEHGVVHRDIKPDNVLLSGGSAMVTDFGIAKALTAAASADATRAGLTQTGLGIGTPAYMAPEQVTGDPRTDHRADIYSFGCLAYELFTGKPPFHGLPSHQVAAAQLGTTPRPVSELRAETPEAVAALIARCLEKDPGQRPQSARELLPGLDGVMTPPNVSVRRRPSFAALGGAALVAVVLAAAIYLLGRKHTPAVNAAAQPISLAVLPLINVGGDSTLEYLAYGLSDELQTALARVPGIQTKSRLGARAFHGQSVLDVRKVGRELEVQYLVTGTLQKAGAILTVRAQLTRALDKVEVWSGQFGGQAALAAVRDEIAQAVSDTLRALFPRAVGIQPRGGIKAANAEALDLYVLGNYLFLSRGRGIRPSVANFQAAIDRDSTFAPAYARLGMALELLWAFEGTDPAAVHDRAMAAARRSLELDGTLAQGHTALALAFFNSSQWDRAEPEFRKALALDPNDADTRIHYGRFLTQRHRLADALSQFQQALKLEPVWAVSSAWAAYSLFQNDRKEEGFKEIERAMTLDPVFLSSTSHAMLMNLAGGRKDVALQIARRMPETPAMSPVSYVFAAAGDSTTAMRMVREIEARQPRPWFARSARAMVMLGVGDTARALAGLEAAASAGDRWFSYLLPLDPAYDPIRRSARFAALIRRAGFPDNFLTASPR